MSDDTSKADTIAFHFYTKLFYTVNHARATEEARAQSKVDKWFNLETPDSDLFTREAREQYRSISQAPPPGPLPMEIQVLLTVPELTNNQALVYISPDSTRVRIEPTPKFILLETWTLGMQGGLDANTDISPPVIYKHGIILFRSVFSLLRVLPSWKFYKRLKRKVGGVNRNGHLGIQLRVRPSGGGVETDRSILGFDELLSPTQRSPLPTSTHTFPPVPHLLGSFTLFTTYLSTPHFQLDELESLLSSRFISLDLEGFVPTLDKNKQRDSLSGSSLPNSSGIRSILSRSPPKMGRTTSSGPAVDNPTVADRFILPTRVPSMGTPSLPALIPPPRPFPSSVIAQPIPASGLAVQRLRKESLNSSSSSSISTRDNPYPTPTAVGTSPSLSSSPIPGALPIRRPHINPVHPFKSNTISSASGSSPSLSIRQGVSGHGHGGGSPNAPASGGIPHGLHSRQPSSPARLPPSPIGTGFEAAHPSPPPAHFSPSSLGDRRPGTANSDRDRRFSMNSVSGAAGERENDDARVTAPMPMPPRKRYSSSFGHRYVSSVGSATGVVVVGSASGSASGSGMSTGVGAGAGEGGKAVVVEAGSLGSGSGSGVGLGIRKEGITSLLGATTDDDDISIFVQHIDERKPLSSHDKEREKRDRDILEQRGQDHDRERSDNTTMTSTTTTATAKGKEKERSSDEQGEEDDGRTRTRSGLGNAPYTTSSPLSAFVPIPSRAPSTPTSNDDDEAESSAAVHLSLSTSPNRGPMLTSRDEVEERLKKMNENFLKSLEGIGGGRTQRRKDREKQKQKSLATTTVGGKSDTSSGSTSNSNSKERAEGAPTDSNDKNNNRHTSPTHFSPRGLEELGFPSTSSRGGGGGGDGRGSAEVYPSYPYNTPSLGLGLGRGRHPSMSSSMLGNSDAMASQGSEEVIGRMELYEERRRSGYHGV